MSTTVSYIVVEKTTDKPIPHITHHITQASARTDFNKSLHSDKCQWIFWALISTTGGITIKEYLGPQP